MLVESSLNPLKLSFVLGTSFGLIGNSIKWVSRAVTNISSLSSTGLNSFGFCAIMGASNVAIGPIFKIKVQNEKVAIILQVALSGLTAYSFSNLAAHIGFTAEPISAAEALFYTAYCPFTFFFGTKVIELLV